MTEPDFKKFSDKVLEAARGYDHVECYDIEDYAVECGLLKEVTATKPCSKNCDCQEYGFYFPTKCLRKNYD